MKNRLFTFAVMAMLCFSVAMAQKVTIDGITYKVKGDHAEVTGSDKKITEAIIKDVVTFEGKEYSVTEIEKAAFATRGQLRKVSIPNSIKIIRESAFDGCRYLTELIVPDNPIVMKLARNNPNWSPFSYCNAITTVRCQNSSFPTYIISSLHWCPFKEAFESGIVQKILQINK